MKKSILSENAAASESEEQVSSTNRVFIRGKRSHLHTCNDHENSVSTPSTSNYVHANVQTGELPAKAFAHHKNNNVHLPPPPPPPEDPPENIPTDSKVLPPPMPVSNSAENQSHIPNPYESRAPVSAGTSSTLADDGQNTGDFGHPLPEPQSHPETRKRRRPCNSCNMKIEMMKQEIETVISDKRRLMENLSEESKKLKKVLAVLKPFYNDTLRDTLSPLLSFPVEVQWAISKQLKFIMTNNSQSGAQEEETWNINADMTIGDVVARVLDS